MDLDIELPLALGLMGGVFALLFAFYKSKWILNIPVENPKLKKIGGYVARGAMAFLFREYKVLVPVVITDLLVIAPQAHDAAQGHLSGRLLDPAIAHCVVLAIATVVSLVKPLGRTPRGRRGEPAAVAPSR